jgi:hypothetical protein
MKKPLAKKFSAALLASTLTLSQAFAAGAGSCAKMNPKPELDRVFTELEKETAREQPLQEIYTRNVYVLMEGTILDRYFAGTQSNTKIEDSLLRDARQMAAYQNRSKNVTCTDEKEESGLSYATDRVHWSCRAPAADARKFEFFYSRQNGTLAACSERVFEKKTALRDAHGAPIMLAVTMTSCIKSQGDTKRGEHEDVKTAYTAQAYVLNKGLPAGVVLRGSDKKDVYAAGTLSRMKADAARAVKDVCSFTLD